MKYKRYSTRTLIEILPDSCMGLCMLNQKKRCDKKQQCLRQLCSDDEKGIAKVSPFAFDLSDSIRKKIEDKVELWRKKQYKKCKKVIFKIVR